MPLINQVTVSLRKFDKFEVGQEILSLKTILVESVNNSYRDLQEEHNEGIRRVSIQRSSAVTSLLRVKRKYLRVLGLKVSFLSLDLCVCARSACSKI